MKKYFKQKIKSKDDALYFIFKLYQDGLLFHVEDLAGDIIDKNGVNVFSKKEAIHIDDRIDEVYNYIKQPVDIFYELSVLDDIDISTLDNWSHTISYIELKTASIVKLINENNESNIDNKLQKLMLFSCLLNKAVDKKLRQ